MSDLLVVFVLGSPKLVGSLRFATAKKLAKERYDMEQSKHLGLDEKAAAAVITKKVNLYSKRKQTVVHNISAIIHDALRAN